MGDSKEEKEGGAARRGRRGKGRQEVSGGVWTRVKNCRGRHLSVST